MLGIAAFIWFRNSDASEMNLNEWGDFAAGAVAPLAFFWLVIGYFPARTRIAAQYKSTEDARGGVATAGRGNSAPCGSDSRGS